MRFVLILSILFSMSSIHAQQTTAVDRFFNSIVEKHPEYSDKIDAVKNYLKSKKLNAKGATIGVTRYAGDFSARYLITDAGIALYCVPRATEDYYTGTGSRQQGWLTGVSPRDGETFDRNPFTANGLNKINPMEGTYRIRLRGGEPVLLVSFIEDDQLEEIWKTYGPVKSVQRQQVSITEELLTEEKLTGGTQLLDDILGYLPKQERAGYSYSLEELINKALESIIKTDKGNLYIVGNLSNDEPPFSKSAFMKAMLFGLKGQKYNGGLFIAIDEMIKDPDNKYNLNSAEKEFFEEQLKKIALLMIQNNAESPYPAGRLSKYPLFYTNIVLNSRQERIKSMEVFLEYFAKAVNDLENTQANRLIKRYAVELKLFYEKFLTIRPSELVFESDIIKTISRLADEAQQEALNQEAPFVAGTVSITKEFTPGSVTHLSAADWTDEQIDAVLKKMAAGEEPEILNNYFMDAYANKIKTSSDAEYKKKNVLRFSSLVEDIDGTKIDVDLLAKYKSLLSKMHEETLVSFDFFELQSYVRTYQKTIDETVGLALEKMAANFDGAAKNILLKEGLYTYLYYDKSRALDFILVSALLLSNGNKLFLTVDELDKVGTLFDKKMYPDRYSATGDLESKDGYGYKLPSYLEGIEAFKASIKTLKLSK